MATLERRYVSKLVPNNRPLLTTLLVMFSVVNSATMGYDSSVMNNLNELPSYTDYFKLNTTTTGLNTAAAWIGNLLGCFIVQPITDILGRKCTIYITSVICFIGIVLHAAAQNSAMFIIARVIVGIGGMVSGAAAPALLAELLPATTRIVWHTSAAPRLATCPTRLKIGSASASAGGTSSAA